MKMFRDAVWVDDEKRLIYGLRRLAKFVDGRIYISHSKWSMLFIVLTKERPVASLEIGRGEGKKLATVTWY